MEMPKDTPAAPVLPESFDWRQIPPDDRYTTDIIPDRLSVEPSNDYHCPIFMRRIAVFLNGIQMPRVIEYSISEGWVRQHRVLSGKVRVSKHGSVIGFKREGKVKVVMIGILKGRVVHDGKQQQIEAVLVRPDGTEFPTGRIDIADLVYREQAQEG